MAPFGNCPACSKLVEMRDMSCNCRRGYMNDEGTFIPGLLVRQRLVLSKEDYDKHLSCEICPKSPERCSFRAGRVRSADGIPDYFLSDDSSSEDDGRTSKRGNWSSKEFFVPSKGISESILKYYTTVNGGSVAKVVSGKRFKGQAGYLVRSRVRYTSEMINEIRKLSKGALSGNIAKRDLKTQVRQPRKGTRVTEFTRFLLPSPSVAQSRGTLPSETHSIRNQQPASDRISSSEDTIASRGQLFPRTGQSRHDDFSTSSNAGIRGGQDNRRGDDKSSGQFGADRDRNTGENRSRDSVSPHTYGGKSYTSKAGRHNKGEDDRYVQYQTSRHATRPNDPHQRSTSSGSALVADVRSQVGPVQYPIPRTSRHLSTNEEEQRTPLSTGSSRRLDETRHAPGRSKEPFERKEQFSIRPRERQQQPDQHRKNVESRRREPPERTTRGPRRYHAEDEDEDDDDDDDEDSVEEQEEDYPKFSKDRSRHM